MRSPDASDHQRVDEAFRAFSKAFRARQLYLANNPMRERALATAREAFAACWREDDTPIRVIVREAEFVCEGRAVLRETERANDGLPWILYRDGVRELTLLPGFEQQEMEALLALLQRARQAAPDEDDLVTLLWVADLETVQYRFVDVSSGLEATTQLPSVGAPSADGPADTRPGHAATSAEFTPVGDGAPNVLRMEDFDSTLYFLDARELAYLQQEVREEFASDPRRTVLATLFDIFELQDDATIRETVLEQVETTLVDLLASGAYELAAYALREARLTTGRLASLSESMRLRLDALAERLSEPAVVAQLLQAVDEGTRAPATDTLELLVAELRSTALAPLLAWVGGAPSGSVRDAVERAVRRLAEQHTAELARLIDDVDAAVVTGAIALSAQLRTPAVVPALARRLRSGDDALRLAAVQALATIGSPGALQHVEPAIEDTDRDVRLAALRAVTTHRHAASAPRLTRQLARKELRTADRSEKAAVFEAFGTVCGEAGVATLDALLNGRSLLGYREPPEIRACAARALAIVGTSSARAALQRSADSREPVVRNEVARALRGASVP
jgi:HEAT repeat protein